MAAIHPRSSGKSMSTSSTRIKVWTLSHATLFLPCNFCDISPGLQASSSDMVISSTTPSFTSSAALPLTKAGAGGNFVVIFCELTVCSDNLNISIE
ncbi:hypothetical protein QL285_061865 [Trifolium repens]|nr:hypothetical protein QL285_061865 [Trifolium repens]